MGDFLPYIVTGLASGAVYGMAGVGLVLTYRTSGVFNFAYGAIATIGAFIFWELWVQNGVPWPVAGAICLFGFAPIAGIILEFVCRNLASAQPAMKIVGFVGLLIGIQGAVVEIFGSNFENVPQFLPDGLFRLDNVAIGYNQLITVVVSLVLVSSLYLFLRATRIGVTMRAVVDDSSLISLAGFNPVQIRRVASIIGAMLATLSGVLLAPVVGLSFSVLTLLVVQAFGAAAIGRFNSLPLTYAGGLAVGILAALSTKYGDTVSWLTGIPGALPFIILFIVLLTAPRRSLIELTAKVLSTGQRVVRKRPGPRRFIGYGATAVVLALIPTWAGYKLPIFTNGMILIIVYLSLSLLVRTSGQISLCHVAFVAIGAAAFCHLSGSYGFPWLAGVIGAGLITLPVGIVIALPAIRLSGLYLGLATFGFGIAIEQLLYTTNIMFGDNALNAARPVLFGMNLGTDRAFFYVALIITGCAIGFVALLRKTRLGRVLRALSDSQLALDHLGVNTTVSKVIVFALSAFLAGIAGALTASFVQVINGDSFDYSMSLYWIAIIVVVSRAGSYGVVLAGVTIVLPQYLGEGFVKVEMILFGAAAVHTAILSARQRKASSRKRLPRLSRSTTPKDTPHLGETAVTV